MKSKYWLTITFLLFTLFSGNAFSQNHLTELDSVRTAIVEQGNTLPNFIRDAKTNYDIRTLERIFESNTSILTAIESYFRMLKIVITSEKELNAETINALNDWLNFIEKQCEYDKEYLDSTLSENQSQEVISQIKIAQANTEKLISALKKAVKENSSILSGNREQ